MLPDLVLQEVHVAVKQSVGRRQNSHRLHPRSTLQLALHGHVGKTSQPEVTAFPEISNQRQDEDEKQFESGRSLTKGSTNRTVFGGSAYMKSLVIRWEPLAIDLNSTPSRFMS